MLCKSLGCLEGAFGVPWGAFGVPWGCLGGALGCLGGALGVPWGCLGVPSGCPWGDLGRGRKNFSKMDLYFLKMLMFNCILHCF